MRYRGRVVGLAIGAVLAACAPAQGWEHTDRRACEPSAAPIVCLRAEPEGPYELRAGGRVLLPGECMQAPQGGRGGRLRTELWSSGSPLARPRVGVRRGMRTDIRIDGKRLEVVERRRCDARVEPDDAQP
ncbi:MAG: hypothetical protein AAGF11_52545 [Myxococcota bacterium]